MIVALPMATEAGRPRLIRWFGAAWRRLRLRHFLIALLIGVLFPVLGPNGGFLILLGPTRSDPIGAFLMGQWVVRFFPVVFAVLVADAAIDDGIRPLPAYGVALLTSAFLGPFLSNALVDLGVAPWNRLRLALHFQATFVQGPLVLWAYGYWRVTQKTLRKIRDAEADRIRAQQRLNGSRLLALQARVDPQLLFDTLSYVGERHMHDPAGADRVLDELIVLLRAMLPDSGSLSSVSRELALTDAWLRVAGHLASIPHLSVQAQPEALDEAMAPMLLVPLIQTTLAAVVAERWSVDCKIVGRRLQLALWDDAESARGAPTDEVLLPLRQRLDQIYGEDAHLIVHPFPLQIVYDLPRLAKDTDR